MTKKIPCEVYTRVVGYFRPVQCMNDGKKEEYYDRKVFDPSKTNSEINTKEVILDEIIVYSMPMCGECNKVKKFLCDNSGNIEQGIGIKILNAKDNLNDVRRFALASCKDLNEVGAPFICLFDNGNYIGMVNDLDSLREILEI